ncbi:acyltransferase family protein [Corynebacterium sp. TAE3-ERU12]|uniref:acyltransferase family protein n=1 Tax=Corynebacterium sp. TAE3-ERU12 TaxID=2849491 RepID=UPI001C4975C0|nr:acyltransferase family protein [Corynebacterium sp. TAE3-ERU12]
MPRSITPSRASAANGIRYGRVQWVDAAKGICIVLVVVGHAITVLQNHGYEPGVWATINLTLGPVRMPLFFLCSGLFAAKALSESWPKLADRRIWVMVWLYVVWVPLREIWMAAIPETQVTDSGAQAPPIADPSSWLPMLGRMAHAAYEPTGYLWFLYALGLYAVLSKLCQNVHPLIQIGVAAVVNIVSPFSGHSWTWAFITQMYVFYLIGMYAAPWIFAMARRRNIWLTLGSLAAYIAAVAYILTHFNNFNEANIGPVRFTMALVGLVAVINVIAMFEGTIVIEPFNRLGSRTLPIFLMHIPMMTVIIFLLNLVLSADPGLPWQPVILALMGIAGCLSLHSVLMKRGGRWLFKRPAWTHFAKA